jgi:glucose-6-phosphate 1-epimerase
MISLPDCIRLTYPAENFPVLEIDHFSCQARVALLGAQVMEWAPRGQDPVLYLSPETILREGKAIRGGIPICWPWFGAHPTDPSKPAHGFVRNRFWEFTGCEDDGASVDLRFELRDSEATRALWDHSFIAVVEIRLGSELHLSLSIHNPGSRPFNESTALHAYFAVSDIDAVEVEGLHEATFDEHSGGQCVPGTQIGPVRIVGEVDRVYHSSADLRLIDDDRIIHVHKHGSASSVIWNPGAEKAARLGDLPPGGERRFVCVETANAADATLAMPPGGNHVLRTRIRVEPRG